MSRNNQNKKQSKPIGKKGSSFYFQTRKEFITWLIGMAVTFGMGIGCCIWAYCDYTYKDGSMTFSLAGCGIAIIGILLWMLIMSWNKEIGAFLFGAALAGGAVLPFVLGRHLYLLRLAAVIGAPGILIMIDNVAKLTKTTDKGDYKVIFGIASAVTDHLAGMQEEEDEKKKSEETKIVEAAFSKAAATYSVIRKIIGIILGAALIALGVLLILAGSVMHGIAVIAFVFLFAFSSNFIKKKKEKKK